MHEIIEINPKDEKYEEYYANNKKINEEIKRIIEFNKLVLNIGERFKNNYFHINNIINLGKSIKEENKRNYKDIKYLLKGLGNSFENLSKAIDYLIDKINIIPQRYNEYIYLNKRELDDEDFKYISHISFNQLIEIDLIKCVCHF